MLWTVGKKGYGSKWTRETTLHLEINSGIYSCKNYYALLLMIRNHNVPGSIMRHRMLPKTVGKKFVIMVYVKQTKLILPFDLRSRDAVAIRENSIFNTLCITYLLALFPTWISNIINEIFGHLDTSMLIYKYVKGTTILVRI